MRRIIFAIGRVLGTTGRAIVALIGIGVIAAFGANYTMTQGSGTTFASAVISTVNYAEQLICDATVGSTQCLTITAAGAAKVDGSAVTQPVSAAAAAIANGASVAQGSTTDVPCTLPATSTACTEVATQKAIANAVSAPSTGLAGTTPTTSTPVASGATSAIQTDLHGNLYIAPSQVVTTGGATTANSVPMVATSQYPVNSVTTTPTPLVAKGAGSTGAVTGTLTPGSTATAYVCGFSVSYVGGTAQVGPLVLSGLLGGSFTYQIPVATATGGQTFGQTFTPCIPASAVNTAIVMTTVADGTATAVDVNIWGYGL